MLPWGTDEILLIGGQTEESRSHNHQSLSRMVSLNLEKNKTENYPLSEQAQVKSYSFTSVENCYRVLDNGNKVLCFARDHRNDPVNDVILSQTRTKDQKKIVLSEEINLSNAKFANFFDAKHMEPNDQSKRRRV